MTRKRLDAAILAGLVALFVAAPVGAGGPVPVICGQMITEDTKVANDLTDCSSDGLVIDADDITLDLKGHVIDGDGSGTGINNRAGHDRVTITNGVIKEFSSGVFLEGASLNHVSKLTVFDIGGVGIFLLSTNDSLVEKNTVSAAEVGIDLGGSSDDNVVTKNSVFNTTDGIEIDSSNRNVISKNSAWNNLDGIFLCFESNNNWIEKNTLWGNNDGIVLFEESNNNVISKNSAFGNIVDGIFIFSDVSGTLVEKNVTNENGDDGIETQNAMTTLTKNKMNDNGDLGIEAVPGVTDGGGNKASGNGNSAQCTNVACS